MKGRGETRTNDRFICRGEIAMEEGRIMRIIFKDMETKMEIEFDGLKCPDNRLRLITVSGNGK